MAPKFQKSIKALIFVIQLLSSRAASLFTKTSQLLSQRKLKICFLGVNKSRPKSMRAGRICILA